MSAGRYLVVHRRSGEKPPDSLDPLPITAEGWFELGTRRMRSARLEEAVQAFRASLGLAPDNPAALANLGFCLVDLSRHEEAVETFDAALRRAPGHYDALFGLAMAHENLGHRDRARDLWLRYIREAPDSPWKEVARRHLGD
jgi:cytochrome c-type biogenesis protein CcmH/NrfG